MFDQRLLIWSVLGLRCILSLLALSLMYIALVNPGLILHKRAAERCQFRKVEMLIARGEDCGAMFYRGGHRELLMVSTPVGKSSPEMRDSNIAT